MPLAGAYVIAASEWLDFEGAAPRPRSSPPNRRRSAPRTSRPAPTARSSSPPRCPSSRTSASPRCTARCCSPASRSSATSRPNSGTGCARTTTCSFPPSEDEARWDIVLLRRVVELWTEVLRGAGPSGLEHAMEIVASIREERPLREPAFLATVDAADETRMRFFSSRSFISPKPRPSCCSSVCTVSPSASTRGSTATSRWRATPPAAIRDSTRASTGCTRLAPHRGAAHRATRAAPRASRESQQERSIAVDVRPRAADEHRAGRCGDWRDDDADARLRAALSECKRSTRAFAVAPRGNAAFIVGEHEPLDRAVGSRAAHVIASSPTTRIRPTSPSRRSREQRRASARLRAVPAESRRLTRCIGCRSTNRGAGTGDIRASGRDGNLENPDSKRNSEVFHKSLSLLVDSACGLLSTSAKSRILNG